jgi:small-conductance mechanosensitive channel
VGELVQATGTAMPVAQRNALARVAQGATLVVALLVGADQVGLKVTWIAIFAAVLVASLLGGLAIAVSLGARGFVANMIGAHYLRQTLRAGQRVRVAGHEGQVLDISATSLVLETADGRVLLPGGLYHQEAIVLIVRDDTA